MRMRGPRFRKRFADGGEARPDLRELLRQGIAPARAPGLPPRIVDEDLGVRSTTDQGQSIDRPYSPVSGSLDPTRIPGGSALSGMMNRAADRVQQAHDDAVARAAIANFKEGRMRSPRPRRFQIGGLNPPALGVPQPTMGGTAPLPPPGAGGPGPGAVPFLGAPGAPPAGTAPAAQANALRAGAGIPPAPVPPVAPITPPALPPTAPAVSAPATGLNPAAIAQAAAAQQAMRPPGMATGGRVAEEGVSKAEKRKPARQWGNIGKSAEEMPTVPLKKAKGGIIHRKPKAVKKPVPQTNIPYQDDAAPSPPPPPPPAVAAPPAMKKGGVMRKNKGGACAKMAAGGAAKERKDFPKVKKMAGGGKVRGCGAATKGTSFSGIF